MGVAQDRPVWQAVKTYWSLLLGNGLEWYEFCLYSFLEPYFEANFFQGSAVVTWLGFAMTFVARPFGGVVLGVIGDLFGRKVSTFLSIFGMLGGTVLQGLLPTFQHGPVAGTIGVCLLVFLRLLQGISAGGEIASVSTYLTEVCHPRVLARTLVLIPITSNVGYFLAQLVSFTAEEFFGEDAMHSWGWRVPFLLAIFPGALAALGRRYIPESERFLEAKAQESRSSAVSKTQQLLASYWPQILVGFGAVAAVSVVLYGGMTWGLVSMKKKGLPSSFRILAGCGANGLVILIAPLVGWVTDTRGSAWVQTFAGFCIAVVGMPLMMMIEWSVMVDSPWSAVALYSLGYSLFGAFLMMHFLQVVELFPVEVRNAGVGLSYNIGVCIFGGFAPMVFEAVSFTSWLPGLLLALSGLVTALTTLVSLRFQSLGKIQLTHLRHEPYFRCCGRENFPFPTLTKESQGSTEPLGQDASPHKKEGIQSVVEVEMNDLAVSPVSEMSQLMASALSEVKQQLQDDLRQLVQEEVASLREQLTRIHENSTRMVSLTLANRKDFEEHRFALSSGKVDETLELSRESRELLLSNCSKLDATWELVQSNKKLIDKNAETILSNKRNIEENRGFIQSNKELIKEEQEKAQAEALTALEKVQALQNELRTQEHTLAEKARIEREIFESQRHQDAMEEEMNRLQDELLEGRKEEMDDLSTKIEAMLQAVGTLLDRIDKPQEDLAHQLRAVSEIARRGNLEINLNNDSLFLVM
eukprot:s1928_g7.t2